ncbi:V-type ATP synthase subunit A [Streptosporangium sp. NBC_01755]|uniref:V-type ATP synthase subunit A n=1 Tax=unclassified Streptosporangium TaxID=2632669 RepID=UPI002DD8AB3D|nr:MULTISPECIES: V-type ATP synthase subunit A [unclassified Streptosporangium]WSA25176.1 V-type ATP synthase subunit A [Streptosporangium sp. NBC_01810]WSD03484.1 V-type ATP synthase subunit A [Streptosporangium sp. NBC_01755]
MPVAVVTRVNGPLVEVSDLRGVAMFDQVTVKGLPGEVVSLRGERATVQMYEYTGGLMPGLPVEATGIPLSAPLGPHLLGGVFDGLLRPLEQASMWLDPRSREGAETRSWRFTPLVAEGRAVEPGAPVGAVTMAGGLSYLVLASGGTVGSIRPAGEYPAEAPIATVGGHEMTMVRRWPIRRALPYRERLAEPVPLITGQRVLDLLLPVQRGGTTAVPGGFGTGKTVLLQQIAKWCDADVVVYVGCGERGNEMADVISELGQLGDPRTGGRLADRTVMIANTSNMPMMAREASIYTGVTVAEHFRDMGYDAVLITDSTSRWAEARREFASRSGALPAEEGYPADLASAIAAFYERAGRVTTLGGRTGSVTILGAVSPPGGDMTEPVTTHTQRFVRTLWSLDRDLAYARHYPAVSWEASFSRDDESLAQWHDRTGREGWAATRARISALLAEADHLSGIAELVGTAALHARERVVLLGGRLLREGLLQQSALSPTDAYCTPERTIALAGTVLAAIDDCLALVSGGVPADEIESRDFSAVLRAKESG